MTFSEQVFQKYALPELDKIDSYAKKLEINEDDTHKIKDMAMKIYNSGNVMLNKNLIGGIIFLITDKQRSEIGEVVGCSKSTISVWKDKVVDLLGKESKIESDK